MMLALSNSVPFLFFACLIAFLPVPPDQVTNPRHQDHIVQWHPTILARLALVPQRTINSYSKDSNGASVDGVYKDGDFVIRFLGCDTDTKRSCEKEMEPYYRLWAGKMKNE